MRRLLIASSVAVLCLPMLLIVSLLLATHWPKMDPVTMQLPDELRKAVAAAVLEKAGFGDNSILRLERASRLDPENAAAWARQCSWYDNLTKPAAALAACQHALKLEDSAGNRYGLGVAQEQAGDECAAEESFTKASSMTSSGNYYTNLEAMGRAALRCGDLYSARAGLETAVLNEEKNLKAPDEDQDEIDDIKAAEQTDREYLVVTLEHLHESAAAKDACSAAHPDWKGCACALDAKAEVSCSEKTR